MMDSIQDRLKAIRKEVGLSQDELAIKTGAKRTTIAGYESGVSLPHAEFLTALNKNYGINSNWLLTGEGDMYIKSEQPPKSLLEQGLEETLATHPKFSEIESRLTALEALIKEAKPAPEPAAPNKDAPDVPARGKSPRFTAESEPEYGEEEEEEYEQIPYVHDIAAGPPINQSEDQSEMIAVPARLIRTSGKYYAASIRGTSMTETGIRDGDMILIRHTEIPKDGAIQVVRHEDRSTLKRVRELEGNRWELHYEDGTGRVITCGTGDYEVQGEFVAVLAGKAIPGKNIRKR